MANLSVGKKVQLPYLAIGNAHTSQKRSTYPQEEPLDAKQFEDYFLA